MDIVLSRRRLSAVLAAAAVAIVIGAGAWWVQPDRSLGRAWNGLLGAVEGQRPSGIRSRLADDYADRWGYNRETLVQDARLAFFHFRDIQLDPRNVHIDRDGNQATIQAIIRLTTEGTGRADDARLSVNSLFTPFTFEWERDSGFPWSWKLKSFDHEELDLGRFRRGSFAPY